MLADIITVLSGELNSGSAVKAVTDRTVTYLDGDVTLTKYYKPTQIRFTNGTGNTIHFLGLTTPEHTSYLAGTLITDLIPVANNGVITMETLRDNEITYMLVSGVSGHSANLSITLVQE